MAVQHLNHLDLIHHDLEPDKVLFVSVAPVRIKLCNFGGARSIVHAHALPLSIPYTPGYTSPEFNTRLHGFGVDVYSLGIIALNMLGFWPWEGVGALPDYRHLPCSDLLDSMLDIDTSRRYTPSDCLDHVWLRRSTRSTKRRLSIDSTTYFPPSKRQKFLGDIPRVTQRPADSRFTSSMLDSLLDSTWKSAIHVQRRTWLRITETYSNYFRGV